MVVVLDKMAAAKGRRGDSVSRGTGNFDTMGVIHVFVAIGVNGACWVTARLALRGAACWDPQSTLQTLEF